MTAVGVDLVLFEIDGVRFGADLAQVRRVDRDDPTESVGTPLGQPRLGHRALVFQRPEGREARLAVDALLGVHRVPLEQLRRLPPTVAAPALSLGAWLDGDRAILLVDLWAMGRDAPDEETRDDHGDE